MDKSAHLSPVLRLYGKNITLLQILLCCFVLDHFIESLSKLHSRLVDLAAYCGKFGTCCVSNFGIGDYRAFKLFEQPLVRLQTRKEIAKLCLGILAMGIPVGKSLYLSQHSRDIHKVTQRNDCSRSCASSRRSNVLEIGKGRSSVLDRKLQSLRSFQTFISYPFKIIVGAQFERHSSGFSI